MAEVLITAGGTRERIDDVRFIGNISSGRLGFALAEQYRQRGHAVLLVASRDSLAKNHLDSDVRYEPFVTSDDLKDILLSQRHKPDILFHAAAVSDYKPQPYLGKIDSTPDELVVKLEKTTKIIRSLRDYYPNSTIVGFKLLSGVSEAELLDTAVRQIRENRTDFCVANDLHDMKVDRKVYLIGREGLRNVVNGNVDEVASGIVDTMIDQ